MHEETVLSLKPPADSAELVATAAAAATQVNSYMRACLDEIAHAHTERSYSAMLTVGGATKSKPKH